MERRALTSDEIAALAQALPQWSVQDGMLVRVATAPSFRVALDWVASIGNAAEAMDHHPDIDIRYRTLTLRLRTHDLDALSTWDIELARQIDAIIG